MRVLLGVVNMVLVSVKVQCAKVCFLVRSRQVVYTITRITLAHIQEIPVFVFDCLVGSRIAFLRLSRLSSARRYIYIYIYIYIYRVYLIYISRLSQVAPRRSRVAPRRSQ